jgi:hypothetical protein
MVILGFDRDLPDWVALSEPGLYSEGLNRTRFNFKVFTLWMISGVWHGSLAWLVPSALIGSREYFITNENGYYEVKMVPDFWLGSCASFALVVLLVDLRLWMIALNKLAAPVLFMMFLSVAACFVTLFGLEAVGMQPQIEGIPEQMMTDKDAQLIIWLTPLACLIDASFYYGAKMLFPSPLDKARRIHGTMSGKAKSNSEAGPQLVKPAQAAW